STDVITSALEIVIALLLGLPLGPAAFASVKQGGLPRRRTWVSTPIDKLIIHAGRSLKLGKAILLARPPTREHRALSQQPVEESSPALSDEALSYQPSGVKL
ncbi:hypothetical protein, partial [Bradyrhizobium guangzhouense]|uniref:hypothetical protein n=1 Tax=Bradyrhizobium guangzhouense TaxID=1325095 RepID=UPI0019D6F6B1